MKQHVIPGIIGAAVALASSLAIHKADPPKQQVVKVQAPAGMAFGESSTVSPAKAKLMAERVWPEMKQAEVDALTVRLGLIGRDKPVTIYCINERCEDLALNLDNAFESAHWKSEVLNGVMIPPGIVCSSQALCDAFNGATSNRYDAKVDTPHNAQGEYIAIGFRQRGGI